MSASPPVAVPGEDTVDREPDFVQSLGRGLAVIRAFDGEHPTLTLAEVAKATGLARAAARRFLLTLVELGYMRIDGRQFRLSPRVLELGRPYLASLTLPELAQPHLRELVEEIHESTSLAVLDNTEIVYIAHLTAKRIMSISISIGARDPASATSLGRALLAAQSDEWLDHYLTTVELTPITPRTITDPDKLRTELNRIRKNGYALVDQELEDGLRALAVPIHDTNGNTIAAINLAVPTTRWTTDSIRTDLLPRLQHTATQIQTDLAARMATLEAQGPVAAAVEPEENAEDREPDFVQSLGRGLAVIRAFDGEHPTLTLAEVAKATGLARAAARRFLLTLVELGYMRIDGRQFRLSPRVLELGRPYLASLTLPELAQPHLRELVEEIHESTSLAVLDNTEIVYIAHLTAKRIMSISISIGARDPALATSLGRALLAAQSDEWLDHYLTTVELTPITPRTITDPDKLRSELNRIRKNGYALVDQELEDGLRALAVPIHDTNGNTIAAINLAVPTTRWTTDSIRTDLLPRLQHTATQIQTDLGASGLDVHELHGPRGT